MQLACVQCQLVYTFVSHWITVQQAAALSRCGVYKVHVCVLQNSRTLMHLAINTQFCTIQIFGNIEEIGLTSKHACCEYHVPYPVVSIHLTVESTGHIPSHTRCKCIQQNTSRVHSMMTEMGPRGTGDRNGLENESMRRGRIMRTEENNNKQE